ncbi:DUF2231 domain-containing protein [Bradyrhizobium sp. 38]|jgi:uncharacterized membrane protein|uniref:DUF2231 domain-containing protein n=1 Tax=unclassified Bradyrhizobium TaxID=2631580 RepID=UPI001FF7B615|nr:MULTISPECIES: DUF2231 domain-containing protein [unclassified Bradyrhizobium]MCK1336353.1 DUF2231 domain-containing protein [Bradyrhizobium sp. 38]MCK1782496.1 DUF2231 domain-containing protein [Bradyrhizobium sp. 132]
MFEVLPNWHPIFVHFSIALFVIAAMLYVVHLVLPQSSWAAPILTAARINLWLGAVLSIATVAAGMQAFLTVQHGAEQQPVINDHRNWALATAVLWWSIALWEGWRSRHSKPMSYFFLAAVLCALAPLAATGWKGAELVYRHGIGVNRLALVERISHLLPNDATHKRLLDRIDTK